MMNSSYPPKSLMFILKAVLPKSLAALQELNGVGEENKFRRVVTAESPLTPCFSATTTARTPKQLPARAVTFHS